MFETRRFMQSEGGAVALIFGFAFVLIVTGIGVSVDYGRAHSIRQEMQATIDAAVLSAAKSKAMHNSDVNTVVNSHVNGSDLVNEHFQIDEISGSSESDGSVSGKIVGRMPTYLMGIVGFEEISLTAESSAAYGSGAIDLVLVLDSTSSMAGTKLDGLKTAATDLVDTLHNVPNAEEVIKIGVVPFARYVNVGLSRRTESWIDVPLEYTENVCYTTQPLISKSGCTMQTATAYDDNVPYTYEYETCTNYEYGPETTTCNDVSHVWVGCVGSRNYPLNVQDADYATKIPGILDVSCANEITVATNDKQKVKDAVTSLAASGDTYIPAGLAWGWRVISKKEPFSEANENDPTASKYLVLMTDGANSRSPDYPAHNASDTDKANELTAELCVNIKAEKIEIFTIAFQVTDPAVKTMLEGCASPGGAFYDAVDVDQLKAAFRDIGTSLTQIRLTK